MYPGLQSKVPQTSRINADFLPNDIIFFRTAAVAIGGKRFAE
jgi:hypothetical protein